MRQALKSVDGIEWLEVSVKQSDQTVGLIARTPQAAIALEARMEGVLRAMAHVAGQMMSVDIKTAPVHVASSPMTLYTIPCLIVTKSKRHDWSSWRDATLSEEQRSFVTQMIRASIESELKAWSVDWQASGIQLIGDGSPMVIVVSQGPRGIARMRVRFVAPWHIEGELFCGKLTPMGYGLIKRGGQIRTLAPALSATS